MRLRTKGAASVAGVTLQESERSPRAFRVSVDLLTPRLLTPRLQSSETTHFCSKLLSWQHFVTVVLRNEHGNLQLTEIENSSQTMKDSNQTTWKVVLLVDRVFLYSIKAPCPQHPNCAQPAFNLPESLTIIIQFPCIQDTGEAPFVTCCLMET